MKRTAVFAASLLVSLVGTTHAQSQDVTDDKRAAIGRLMEITGAIDIGKQMSEAVGHQMSAALRAARPDLPPEIFDAVSEVVGQVIEENIPEFEALLIPIYDRHFSLAELEELIGFYQTELGRKVVVTLPSIMQESMSVGQRWGQGLGPEIQSRVIERLIEEGLNLAEPTG